MMLVAVFPVLLWVPGPRPLGRLCIHIHISEEQSEPQNEHMPANGRAADARIHQGPPLGCACRAPGHIPWGKKKTKKTCKNAKKKKKGENLGETSQLGTDRGCAAGPPGGEREGESERARKEGKKEGGEKERSPLPALPSPRLASPLPATERDRGAWRGGPGRQWARAGRCAALGPRGAARLGSAELRQRGSACAARQPRRGAAGDAGGAGRGAAPGKGGGNGPATRLCPGLIAGRQLRRAGRGRRDRRRPASGRRERGEAELGGSELRGSRRCGKGRLRGPRVAPRGEESPWARRDNDARGQRSVQRERHRSELIRAAASSGGAMQLSR